MDQSNSSPSDLTQLVRYVLEIKSLHDDAAIVRVREVLTGLGLLVDRVEGNEVEVAAGHSAKPVTDDIDKALRKAGFELVNFTPTVG
ncbi:hypothetical protein [Hymenobacter jejuensis]|uniref:Copper chaperone n=1 Tax=Hymenobacter jejuensis TaxID=2502781 RepID=A0A5B8A2A3_9BACT|nr:hypothetical protein [Hymenobacter jejuensis]QDA61521.1 hypothetical protein FHG12_16080 [Hymenobacter jejuensis]